MAQQQSQEILFSDHFQISPTILEEYGAFNISVLADLPLFIDPFLLFNSEKPEYRALHDEIIRYLRFLHDRSTTGQVDDGLLRAWYYFQEVKQTWLGFSLGGNRGSGLGPKFAKALDRNFSRLFGDDMGVSVTISKHLEKLCLISDGVGRDNISDFTTNLIKGYLLTFTQDFARRYLLPSQCGTFPVLRVRFNYDTESWLTASFYLPRLRDDYVILVPRDLLTKDETWINRPDLFSSFDRLPQAIPDAALRAQVNNYFRKALPRRPKEGDRRKAIQATIEAFPELLDYYIRNKEDRGDQAVSISNQKVEFAETLFLQNYTKLAALVLERTDFSDHDPATLEGTLARVHCLKRVIEHEGGYQFLHISEKKPVGREDELSILQPFLWFAQVSTVTQRKSAVPVKFKLASNNTLGNFLKKRVNEDVLAKQNGEDIKNEVFVVFHFSDAEREKVQRSLRELNLAQHHIVLIDASMPEEVISQELEEPTRVFISYSHDSDLHRKRVRELSERLRTEGVDCMIDQYVANPPNNSWPRWMMDQIEEADFVLVVATDIYNRRFRGKEEPGKGFGAQWEGAIITQEIYEEGGGQHKFIPVIFEDSDAQHIPLPLRGATRYNVTVDERYDDLYYYVTHQPPYKPPLGSVRKRP